MLASASAMAEPYVSSLRWAAARFAKRTAEGEFSSASL
jgi:hypothetical protein